MTAWTHVYSPKLNKAIKGVQKTQLYYSIYHEKIHLAMLTALWNIWQLTDRPEARLWMCGVNNVNLPVIYGKLCHSTLTLTDYRFSTSLTN